MAKLTKRLDLWAFPPICASCQAKAEVPYTLECRSGIDLFWFRQVTIAKIPIPLCASCEVKRLWIGWIAVGLCAAGIFAGIALCVWGPRDRQGDVELYAIGSGVAIVMGLIWYGRNYLRRHLDRWLLGVSGKSFNPSTNELTLWFRDSASAIEKAVTERFVAVPVTERESAPSGSRFAKTTASHIDRRNCEIEKHRSQILVKILATRYRLQIPKRPLLIVGVVFCYSLALYFQLNLQDDVQRRADLRNDSRILYVSMAFVGTVLLGFVGLTITVGGNQITRSFWGMKKSIDRTTSTLHSYGSNYFKIVDASGKTLIVSSQLENYGLLLEECELRTDAMHP